MTAKAKIASICWPATDSPAGCGIKTIAASATTATGKPQLLIGYVRGFGAAIDADGGPASGTVWSAFAMFRLPCVPALSSPLVTLKPRETLAVFFSARAGFLCADSDPPRHRAIAEG